MRIYQLILLTMLFPVLTNAQSDLFEKHIFEQEGQEMPYRLLVPEDYDPNEEYPLLLFLHGAGERGDDNEIVLNHIAPIVTAEGHRTKYPAFVLIPQCPEDQKWVDTDWKALEHDMPEMSNEMELVCQLLDKIVDEKSIDESRIYVMGISMGGFGTWDIISRMPDYFAAAVPICGGGDLNQAKVCVGTSCWAFHGGNDKLVKPSRSRNMVKAIEEAGGNRIRYTEYDGVGHGSWIPAFKEEDMWEWLFNQELK